VFIKAKLNIITEYKEEGYYFIKEFITIKEAILDKYSEDFALYAFTNNSLMIKILKLTNVLEIIINNKVYICNLEPNIA
jgi:hypothetical protein